MKIVLVASDLTTGGAQRVMLILAGIWSTLDHSISIVTTYDRVDHFAAPPGVELVRLAAVTEADQARAFERMQVRYKQTGNIADIGTELLRDLAIAGCAHRLRSTITASGAEIVIAFGGNANLLAALACAGLPYVHLIVREGNDPEQVANDHIYNAIRRFTFERAGSVICNTRSGTAAIQRLLPRSGVRYLPNPVDRPALPHAPTADPSVLTVGRLARQKDHVSLLRAFALWSRPGARLQILGSGNLEAWLRGIAEREGIAHSVDWHGFVPDPSPHYRSATMFVLPSRYEGMPMALLEAMNARLPCIVTNGSRSLLEIVQHERTGLVVPAEDPAALAAAIQRLADDPDLRGALGDAAHRFVQRFSLDTTLRRWNALFRDIGAVLGTGPPEHL